MVIGSRRNGAVIEKAQPLYRRVGSTGFRLFMQTVVGLPAFRTPSAASSSSPTTWPRNSSAARRWTATCSTWRFWPSAGAWATASSRFPSAGATTPIAGSTWSAGNLRNVRDIFQIGLEHRFGGSFTVKTLVTGAAGFIGSNLVDRLLADGHEVTGLDNFSTGFRQFLEGAQANPRFRLVEADLLDLDAVKAAVAGAEFVFHLAANADVRFGPDHPRRDLEQNTIATWNVLEAMRAGGVRRIAFSSTGSVYGEPEIFPTPETAPFPVQTSLYGASKLAAEGHDRGLRDGLRLPGVHLPLRLDSGRALHPRPRLRFLPPAAGPSRPPPTCWATACSARVLPVRAGLPDAILLAAERGADGVNIFNLGTDEYCQVNDSIGWISAASGAVAASSSTRAASAAGWATARSSSWIARACAQLGWKPALSIEQGIVRTLEYLRANPWVLEARA